MGKLHLETYVEQMKRVRGRMRHWPPAGRVLRDGNRARRVCVRAQEADGWRETTHAHGRANEDEHRGREVRERRHGRERAKQLHPSGREGLLRGAQGGYAVWQPDLRRAHGAGRAARRRVPPVDSSELADHDGASRRVCRVPECVAFASSSPLVSVWKKPDRLFHDRTYVARSVTYSSSPLTRTSTSLGMVAWAFRVRRSGVPTI